MVQRRVLLALVWFGLGCDGLEPPTESEVASGVVVELEPALGSGQEAVSVGVRFRVAASVPLPHLFEGELSAQQRSRALSREPPQSLQRRKVSWLVQALGDKGVRLTPEQLLAPDTVYTLVAPGYAQVFRTRSDETTAHLAWPADGSAGMAALYCFAERHLAREPVVLDGGFGARWGEIGADGCQVLELEESAPKEGVVGPARRGPWILPPVVFGAAAARLPSATCSAAGFTSIELACVRVLDDRIEVRGPNQATLWLMRGAFAAVVPLQANGVVAAKGLTPRHRHSLDWVVYPQRGGRARIEFELASAPPQPHIVLNEVLANPNGAEPDQEWIELFNDGTRPANLDGWKLLDAGGETRLPAVNLLPDQYVLIVNETFDRSSTVDVVPEANALVVEVAKLGKSGLSNAGEALRLVDKDGMVRSSFPSTPKPLAGVSIARRYPWALDDEVASFGVHAPPGASPGGRNVLAGEQ